MSLSPQRKPDPAEPEQARLVEALTAFVRTQCGGELEALGRKIDELDVTLSRRIADLDERIESNLGQLKRELATDVAAVRQSGEGALGRLAERLDGFASKVDAVERGFERDMRPRMEALDRLVGDVDERLARRIREATKVEQDLRAGFDALAEKAKGEIATEREAREALAERVKALSESMAAAQKSIEQQLDTSERLSTVLNTLTSVFTTQRTGALAAAGSDGQAGSEMQRRSPDPATGTISDSSLGDLDSVLNKLFPR